MILWPNLIEIVLGQGICHGLWQLREPLPGWHHGLAKAFVGKERISRIVKTSRAGAGGDQGSGELALIAQHCLAMQEGLAI